MGFDSAPKKQESMWDSFPGSILKEAGTDLLGAMVFGGQADAKPKTEQLLSVFGGMFDGPKKPSSLAAAGFEIVPEGTKATKPNQLTKEQYADLVANGFDGMSVVSGGGKLGNDQMTPDQYKALVESWVKIGQGQGMAIDAEGEKDPAKAAAEVDEFKKMLSGGMADSPELRQLVTDLGNEDDDHKVHVHVGRNQDDVFVDSFENDDVDLDDLEKFDATPDATRPEEQTRAELITHFLTERKYDNENDGTFDQAHAAGVEAQNSYRAERGQTAVTAQHDSKFHPGDAWYTADFADGNSEYVHAAGADIDLPDGKNPHVVIEPTIK